MFMWYNDFFSWIKKKLPFIIGFSITLAVVVVVMSCTVIRDGVTRDIRQSLVNTEVIKYEETQN